MNRRAFLGAAAGFAAAGMAAPSEPVPIIDTHIHLYDPTRPGGVPYPTPDLVALYRPTLPDRYRKVAAPLGVVGAIEVECSPFLEDNQWVLDVMAKDKIMVGTVGDLEPGKPGFRRNLERFHKNPLFLGIRYGNLWGRDLHADLGSPTFIGDMKAFARAGLEMDSASPLPSDIADVRRLADLVPELRLVLAHLPGLTPPASGPERTNYYANLRELARRPHVFVKISEVVRYDNGRVPLDVAFYRGRLDEIWDIFGEDRVIFGSDWPNCERWTAMPNVLHIVRDYFTAKGRAAAEKFFWKNSIAAYRWVHRDPTQPRLG